MMCNPLVYYFLFDNPSWDEFKTPFWLKLKTGFMPAIRLAEGVIPVNNKVEKSNRLPHYYYLVPDRVKEYSLWAEIQATQPLGHLSPAIQWIEYEKRVGRRKGATSKMRTPDEWWEKVYIPLLWENLRPQFEFVKNQFRDIMEVGASDAQVRDFFVDNFFVKGVTFLSMQFNNEMINACKNADITIQNYEGMFQHYMQLTSHRGPEFMPIEDFFSVCRKFGSRKVVKSIMEAPLGMETSVVVQAIEDHADEEDDGAPFGDANMVGAF